MVSSFLQVFTVEFWLECMKRCDEVTHLLAHAQAQIHTAALYTDVPNQGMIITVYEASAATRSLMPACACPRKGIHTLELPLTTGRGMHRGGSKRLTRAHAHARAYTLSNSLYMFIVEVHSAPVPIHVGQVGIWSMPHANASLHGAGHADIGHCTATSSQSGVKRIARTSVCVCLQVTAVKNGILAFARALPRGALR